MAKATSPGSQLIKERRVKKRTSIGDSVRSRYKGKNNKKSVYRGQGK